MAARLRRQGKVESRTAAPAMLTRPNSRKVIMAKSRRPRFLSIPLVPVANAGTGTDTTPTPRSPSISTFTCQEPNAISHNCPVKRLASDDDRAARSGVGGNLLPGPVRGIGRIFTTRIPGVFTRTSTCAVPGITSGGRIAISTG